MLPSLKALVGSMCWKCVHERCDWLLCGPGGPTDSVHCVPCRRTTIVACADSLLHVRLLAAEISSTDVVRLPQGASAMPSRCDQRC